MRLIAVAGFAALLATSAESDSSRNCAAAWRNIPPADRGAMTNKAWSAKCLKTTYRVGEYGIPSSAMVICKDGHFSGRKEAADSCSDHAGVAKLR
jgi:hypothetical protein